MFAEEILDKKLLLKLKKSKHVEYKKLVNLNNSNVIFEPENVKRTDYVEKKQEIDHSRLYSFDAPFQLFHADVGNLEFLGKNATFPQYVLVLVDLFSSKTTCTQWNLEIRLDKSLSSFIEMLKAKKINQWKKEVASRSRISESKNARFKWFKQSRDVFNSY